MNIYDAIMKAADRIEAAPHDYDWHKTNTGHCGTPACMLGWIGRMLGLGNYVSNIDVVKRLGVATHGFYTRIDQLTNLPTYTSVPHIVRGMRLYAEQYHGHEKPKPVTPPDWSAIASKWTVGDEVRSQELVS